MCRSWVCFQRFTLNRYPNLRSHCLWLVDCVWNVMAHAQEPDFVFRRKGRAHLNRRGPQFSRLLPAEVCTSVVVMVVMLDTPCSEVVWWVLVTHSIRQFPLQFPSRASPCVITFQLNSTHYFPEEWNRMFVTKDVSTTSAPRHVINIDTESPWMLDISAQPP
jgi:hypothetical protein